MRMTTLLRYSLNINTLVAIRSLQQVMSNSFKNHFLMANKSIAYLTDIAAPHILQFKYKRG